MPFAVLRTVCAHVGAFMRRVCFGRSVWWCWCARMCVMCPSLSHPAHCSLSIPTMAWRDVKTRHIASIALSHEEANSLSKRLRACCMPFTRKVQESGGLLPVVEDEEFYVVQPTAHGNLCRAPPSSSNRENRCAIAAEMLGTWCCGIRDARKI